jgi:hypothetical protein
MHIQNYKDFFAGLLFVGAGGVFAWGATAYPVGQAANMGSGYFPLVLGLLLAGVGLLMMIRALAFQAGPVERLGPWAWRPLLFILAANLVFGALLGGLPSLKLPAMGLIAAIYALTFMASLAGGTFKFKEALVLATVLAGLSYLAFVLLLKLQLPVWPAFISSAI